MRNGIATVHISIIRFYRNIKLEYVTCSKISCQLEF